MEKLLREVSAKNISEYIVKMSDFGERPDGSQGDLKCCEYISGLFARFGLQVNQQRVEVPAIERMQCLLKVVNPIEKEIECTPFLRSGLTSQQGISAEIVFVEKAHSKDCQTQNIKGKIALAHEVRPYESSIFSTDRMRNVREEGGIGLIFSEARNDNYVTTFGLDREIAPIPVVGIGYSDFLFLRKKTEKETINAWMKVYGDIKEGHSENISAQLSGSKYPDQSIILVGSHHETVPGCPGANDNASGIAIMLEVARVLPSISPNNSIIFVSSCGEEGGGFGIEEYLDAFSGSLKKIKAVIVVDQVAGADVPLLVKHTDPSTNKTLETSDWLNHLLLSQAEQLGYQLSQKNVSTGFADATPFVKAGIPASILTGFLADAWYHTCEDTADKVNPNLIKTYAEIILATIMEIDSIDT